MDDIRAMVLLRLGLQSLIDLLRDRGWTVIGPTVRDGVVAHAEVKPVDQLPRGVGDLQGGGSYRLRERDDEALFGYVVGPQGWKSLLFPSRELLWSGQRDGAEMDVEPAATGAPRVSRCSGSGPATCTLGLAAVVELGRSLDLLPRSLVVIGVEATQFDTGSPMSDAVEAAVPAAADAVFTAIDNSAGWS